MDWGSARVKGQTWQPWEKITLFLPPDFTVLVSLTKLKGWVHDPYIYNAGISLSHAHLMRPDVLRYAKAN